MRVNDEIAIRFGFIPATAGEHFDSHKIPCLDAIVWIKWNCWLGQALWNSMGLIIVALLLGRIDEVQHTSS
jgi:hypothetical protein